MPTDLLSNIVLFPFFIAICFFAIYLPGRLVRRSIMSGQDSLYNLQFDLIFGITLIILMTIVFGLLKLRFLALPFLVATSVMSLITFRLRKIKLDSKLIVLLLAGVLIQGFINFPSGLKYADGLRYWSSQGHDGLWHVSLMEEIRHNFPPLNPLFADSPLQNYHYTADIFMGEFYRLFPFFDSQNLYFRFYPVLFSVLIGLTTFNLGRYLWNKRVGYWAVFFTYLCGSFGYFVSIINGQFPLSGETTFWASQTNTILGNPPHTLGIIYLTSIALCLALWLTKRNSYLLFIVFILGFGLSTVKVSAGATLVAATIIAGLWDYYTQKKPQLLLLGIILAITNYACLKLISPTAASFLIFEPLWFPRTMMVVRLNNIDWELRRQHYLSLHSLKGNLHLILHELSAVVLFIVGNSGMRILGLAYLVKYFKQRPKTVEVFVWSIIFVPLIVVHLFVQKGITFNLIQFMQIYLHFLGFFAAVIVVRLFDHLRHRSIKYTAIFIFIALAIPTSLGNLYDFYGPGKSPVAVIKNSEIDALEWLKKNTSEKAVIFTKPFDKDYHYGFNSQPLPIAAWYSTSYLNALTGRTTLLTGEEQLTITGYDIEKKQSLYRSLFKPYQGNPFRDEQSKSERDEIIDRINNDRLDIIKEIDFDYLYLGKWEMGGLAPLSLPELVKVYENQDVVIYHHEQK